MQGYYKLADHFKWVLNKVFDELHAKRVVILEDDMKISNDFFEFMGATSVLLDVDETLMAVSAWNDNGQVISFHSLIFFVAFSKSIIDRTCLGFRTNH